MPRVRTKNQTESNTRVKARGGSIGPYAQGKLYCGTCGEYRRYGVDVVTYHDCRPRCIECNIVVRQKGRHWIRARSQQPARY
jgi:hypothetical protein